MKNKYYSIQILLSTLFLICSFPSFSQHTNEEAAQIKFYENKNQWPEHVLYKTSQDAGNIWLEKGRVLYHFMDFSEVSHGEVVDALQMNDLSIPQALVSATFVGANLMAENRKSYPTKHYQNYFKGSDSGSWATDVRGYGEVEYIDFYEGIDLVFFEKDQSLKYEFHLAPFSDPTQIQIKYEGHNAIKIEEDGSLVVRTEIGQIVENKPFAYQSINGQVKTVLCSFQLEDDYVTFSLGEYNPTEVLIIDPELIFSTFAGSVSDSHGWATTYGNDGSAYTGGLIFGADYPTPTPSWNTTPTLSEATLGISDVFVSKYSADGTTMLWTNFIGGGDNMQGTETIQSMICDADDNVYLYGATSSLDFPILGGFQPHHGGGTPLNIAYTGTDFGTGGTDIFVSKLSADGTELLGATYIGGSGNDGINYNVSAGIYSTPTNYDSITSSYSDQFKGEIRLDTDNNITVVSSTWSNDFPVLDGFQMISGGQQDVVVFKIANDCSELLWSSYFGGSNNDAGNSLVIDPADNVFITGGTCSDDLPATSGGFQEDFNGGVADGFIAKMTGDGETLLQSTYVGTNSYDHSYLLALDAVNDVYVFGVSNGEMPITMGKYANESSTGFLWKMNNGLTETEFTTSIGKGSLDAIWLPTAFSVNYCNRIYMVGWGGSPLGGAELTGMPTTAGAFQEDSPNGFDFYMMVLDPEAENLEYGSYFGGDNAREHADGGNSRFDEDGILYQAVCGGCGGYSDLPTSDGAWSGNNLSSNCNGAIYKFDLYVFDKAEIEVLDDTVCINEGVVALSGFPDGGIFTGTGVEGTEFDPEIAGVGNHTIYYNIEDEEGCRETFDSLVITVKTCIDDMGLSGFNPSKVLIFPNPFDDFTTILFAEDLKENHTIIIYDVLGQEVYRNEKVIGTGLQINKEELGIGMYLLSIYNSESQEIFNTKLMVE